MAIPIRRIDALSQISGRSLVILLIILEVLMILEAGNAIRTRDINLGKVALYH